ncbi:diadenylate cyclase [Roseimaritima ulvae]|uniref:DisA bacterial checkpoint controller nucleotide-binding protein n=1 Tax=Roseimaritima ulvae TaxID=980254 RepID=A0A5B9QPE8_9BACT|nr:diadenylate cyclase [Roseimaritima ulvae]QEG40957.1 DisA bacterial checkpoint controller nucleotide-binding protein [Roseimaritima ulvae]
MTNCWRYPAVPCRLEVNQPWWDQFRFADAVDIAIVAVLLYALFIWLHDRASRSLGIATGMLVVVFFLARSLDLYLTMLAFQYGLIGLSLVFLIVFQQDIRHGFERFTSATWLNTSRTARASDQAVSVILEALKEMAESRIGALLVFPGREPLERHVRGGVMVGAELSTPLLLSIFHPKSPGHDGAVLIKDSRIHTLGLHLPLTAHVDQLGGGGTRHAAALGLADCCDALVLVVSEERGTISVAQNGRLETLQEQQLAEALQAYFGSHETKQRAPEKHPIQKLVTPLAALAAATALWFSFAYHTDTIERTFVVPIEYRNVPEQWEIEEPKPKYAEVTLSGSDPAFKLLDPTNVAVSLEIGDVNGGRVFRWNTESNLSNMVTELEIQRVVPETVTVALREKQP